MDVSRNDGEDGAKVNQFFGSTSERLLVTMKGDGGRHSPLEWGYVARIRSHTFGDALMHREKSFTWRTSRKPATVVSRR